MLQQVRSPLYIPEETIHHGSRLIRLCGQPERVCLRVEVLATLPARPGNVDEEQDRARADPESEEEVEGVGGVVWVG